MSAKELIDGAKLKRVHPEDIPEHTIQNHYLPILQKFVALKADAVWVQIDWPPGTTNGQVQAVASGLANTARRNDFAVKIVRREGEIYLVRARAVPKVVALKVQP